MKSVRDSVRDMKSVRNSIWDSVRHPVRDSSVVDSANNSVRRSVEVSGLNSVWDSVCNSVRRGILWWAL